MTATTYELSASDRSTLAKAREAAGHSQASLGKTLGVASQAINMVERGARPVCPKLLHRWCRAIGLVFKVQIDLKKVSKKPKKKE